MANEALKLPADDACIRRTCTWRNADQNSDADHVSPWEISWHGLGTGRSVVTKP